MIDPDLDGSGQLRPIVVGVILAMASAFVRLLTEENRPHFFRLTLESITCGLLTFTVAYGLLALDVASGWIIFAGGVIGNAGSYYVKVLGQKFIEARIPGFNSEKKDK